MTAPLLEAEDLQRHYPVTRGLLGGRRIGTVRAVDGVSFVLHRGETLGLVGESGCGKSTLARLILRLIEPSAGTLRFDGQDITAMTGEPLRRLRRSMQMIFQDPFASLNPRMTVAELLEEPLLVHGIGDRAARRERVGELLALVGLADHHAARHPHEFSGGQRQRIGIARALAVQPSLVVCDEPVSALDVSIQAQIVNLLGELQQRLRLSYLFIAHDLAVVKHVADRVAVMYLGRILEIGPADSLFADPRHPYTRALIAAVPKARPGDAAPAAQPLAEPPSPLALPGGCRFHPRCAFAIELCRREEPALAPWGEDHFTACHRAAELPPMPPSGEDAAPPMTARRLALYAQRRPAPLPG
jgi:oligopeptide transport system ATP-binding protein